MGKKYNQLAYEERLLIGLLLGAGLSIREIADEINRSPSTISREIRRNSALSGGGKYQSRKAESKAMERRTKSRKFPRLKNKRIREYVRKKIRLGWSPELIAGRMPLELPDESISHEAIYQFIYHEEPTLIPSLSQARKKRQRRPHSKNYGGMPIPQRVSIEERPTHIALRKEPGHWEVDTALSNKKGKAALLVVTERTSRYTRIAKLARKNSKEVEQALLQILATYPNSLRKTLTYDNGSENSRHQFVNEALSTKSYFCHPYHSWEKGSVENTISLIRRRLQKKKNLDYVSQQEINEIQNWINNRPKKCLDFQTPYEIFYANRVALTP